MGLQIFTHMNGFAFPCQLVLLYLYSFLHPFLAKRKTYFPTGDESHGRKPKIANENTSNHDVYLDTHGFKPLTKKLTNHIYISYIPRTQMTLVLIEVWALFDKVDLQKQRSTVGFIGIYTSRPSDLACRLEACGCSTGTVGRIQPYLPRRHTCHEEVLVANHFVSTYTPEN